MKPSEVLREARNLLFEQGWCKNALRNPRGEFCALGAINMADHGTEFGCGLDANPSRDYLLAAVGEPPHALLSAWNNAPDRTFGEVVEAFEKAEKFAEADGQ